MSFLRCRRASPFSCCCAVISAQQPRVCLGQAEKPWKSSFPFCWYWCQVATASLRAEEPNSWPHYFLLPSAIPCLQWFPLTRSSISEDLCPILFRAGMLVGVIATEQRWGRGAGIKHRALCQGGREQILNPAVPVQYPISVFEVC